LRSVKEEGGGRRVKRTSEFAVLEAQGGIFVKMRGGREEE